MITKKIERVGVCLCAVLLCAATLSAQRYEKPPQEIMDVLNAPSLPATSLSPTKDKLALLEPLRYPPIAELAQPMNRRPPRKATKEPRVTAMDAVAAPRTPQSVPRARVHRRPRRSMR